MLTLVGVAAKPITDNDVISGQISAGGVYLVVLLVLVLTLAITIYFLRQRRFLPRSLNMVTLLVCVPKGSKKAERQTEEPQKEEKDIISVAEQFYSTLTAVNAKGSIWQKLFFGRDVIALEIAVIGKVIYFFVAVPKQLVGFVHDAIVASYPKANVEVIPEYNMFIPGAFFQTASLELKKKHYLPFKTYKNLEADPLSVITSAMSRVEEIEGAALQIVIRLAKKNWRQKGIKIARKMQQGKSLSKAQSRFGESTTTGVSKTFQKITETKSEKEKRKMQGARDAEPMRLTPMQEETVKAIEEKSNKIAFEVNIRLVASATTSEKAESIRQNMLGAFNQFSSPEFNSFKVKTSSGKKTLEEFVFRYFNWQHKMVLNTEELASIFHFPTKFTETPNIKWLGAKTAPCPETVPKEGILIGRNNYRGSATDIHIQRDDRRRHTYIIGQTGVGKSVLLQNMAIQDIQNGEGVCVIDPHGDLVEDILENIPKERVDDVIVFEPADTARPMGLNILEFKSDEQKDFAVQEMISIFYKLFPPEMMGPMFEHNMRNVMLTLMEDEESPGTITDIPRMFTDKEFQAYKLSKVKNMVVRQFWEKEMAQTTDFHKSEMLGYLISKVGRFVENTMMRNIIGQQKSGFDLRDVMDNKKVLLVNLSKGKVGEVNSNLLGLILVSKIQMAALGRADMPQAERQDFYLYIDEFQNYTTDSIATILSEARKYRLNMIIAHQYVSQLIKDNQDTKIRDAVFGNVGTICAFRVGVDDAEIMAKQFEPVFDENDVINVDKYNAFVRLMINNTASRAFSMQALPPPSERNIELAGKIKELSRLKYARDRKIVEAEITERGKLGNTEAKINFDANTSMR